MWNSLVYTLISIIPAFSHAVNLFLEVVPTHVFLTGAVQMGKSTVVDRVLARTALVPGGFCTAFGPDRASPERLLYLYPAAGPCRPEEGRVVARFTAGVPRPMPERFDRLGCAALEAPGAQVLVMDECGRLEREALAFRAAVLALLDGDVPVLGVVREGLPGWTAAIAAHPAVRLVTVTKENRDSLPERLSLWLSAK
ncbi:hypothetical protein CE91St41_10760 [Oscillospiraceae bacterium]|nr:hypothetical protein CE91St40_26780 [Oscillospiraceae bacterium]BDF74187.1 hypothetical protein CE91St41_10760 [Oscillospiraceae bacterium]